MIASGTFDPPKESDISGLLTKPYISDQLTPDSDEKAVSERWLVTICATSLMLEGHDEPLVPAFILHAILLRHLALSQRRLPLISFSNHAEDIVTAFISVFAQTAKSILNDKIWTETMRDGGIDFDLADLVDGRLFRVIIELLSKGSFESSLPQIVKDEWNVASEAIRSITGVSLKLDVIPEMHIQEPQAKLAISTTNDVGEIAILPFNNPVFDKHLDCIHVTTETSLPTRMQALKLYRETSHWHNHRKPLNPKQLPEVKVSKWRNPLRTNQFYM